MFLAFVCKAEGGGYSTCTRAMEATSQENRSRFRLVLTAKQRKGKDGVGETTPLSIKNPKKVNEQYSNNNNASMSGQLETNKCAEENVEFRMPTEQFPA